MRLTDHHSVAALRERAAWRLPRPILDHINGGAEDEIALSEAVSALDRWRWMPRALVDVSALDTTARLFGRTVPMPLCGPRLD